MQRAKLNNNTGRRLSYSNWGGVGQLKYSTVFGMERTSGLSIAAWAWLTIELDRADKESSPGFGAVAARISFFTTLYLLVTISDSDCTEMEHHAQPQLEDPIPSTVPPSLKRYLLTTLQWHSICCISPTLTTMWSYSHLLELPCSWHFCTDSQLSS